LTTYKQCLDQAGIPYDESLVIHCGFTLDDGYHAAEKLLSLDSPPTAIIGINDLMAFGAMQAALQHGLRIPEDVSIAGFDDLPMSSLLSPPLTTGRADGAEIGRQCVRLVLARLKNPDLPPQHVHLQTRLVVRASTGPCLHNQVSAIFKQVGAA
jgi:LacI family transcriptional regulator